MLPAMASAVTQVKDPARIATPTMSVVSSAANPANPALPEKTERTQR